MTVPYFSRYFGIDYSGAETPDSSLKGLRLYETKRESMPVEVKPPSSPRKYWTRRGLAEWLSDQLSNDVPTLVGIDHSFSFPLRYFEVHHLAPDWPTFLDDFQEHWPTDAENTYVDFIRDGRRGDGKTRSGNARWRRIAEERAGAKSVFHFDVPGSVAKSTHAGLPWLRIFAQTARRARSLLAVRRLGDPNWAISHYRGIPILVEQELFTGGSHA